MSTSHTAPVEEAPEDASDDDSHRSTEKDQSANGEGNVKGFKRAANNRRSLILRRGDTELSIDDSGIQRFLPRCMQFAFADREAERLYREYYENEKRSDFKSLLTIVLIVNIVLFLLYATTYTTQHLPQMSVLLLCAALIVLIIYHGRTREPRGRLSPLWSMIPFIMWSVQIAHLFCDLWLYEVPRLPNDSVSWVLLYTYSIYVIFPLRLRVCVTLALAMAFIHLAFVGFNHVRELFVNQVRAVVLLPI